jgi:hypothetical protein
MRFINLTTGYNLLQVLIIKRSYSTKDDYFSPHIQFTPIYLLPKQGLNHKKYSEQKINTIYFTESNGHNMTMHANIQYDNMHIFL